MNKMKKWSVILGCGALMIISTPALTHAATDLLGVKTDTRTVIGTDERVKVTDTTIAPYSSIVYIHAATSETKSSSGTGVVVGKDTIITAAHVVDATSKSLTNKSYVAPGRSGTNYPFGKFTMESIHIHPDYSDGTRNHDIAIIKLKPSNGKHVGDVVPIISVKDVFKVPNKQKIKIAGYGSDKNKELWESVGPLASQSEYRLHYTLDTIGGVSGSPIWNENNQLIGVHTTGHSTENSGVRITGSNYHFVKQYLDQTSAEDTEAPSQVTGLQSKNITSNSFDLSWNAATDNIEVVNYEIFQDNKYIGESKTTNFSVKQLKANASYHFTVIALDAKGNRSKISTPLKVTTKENASEDKTTWEKSKVYVSGDTVYYKGEKYKAQWWTQGNEPSTAEVWKKIHRGAVAWDANTAYVGGDIVIYDSQQYSAKWWTRGDKPGIAEVWEKR